MKLISISLIGLMLAGVIYVSQQAGAQTLHAQQSTCDAEPRDVALYFERDKVELNTFSKTMVERVATEAKSCGVTQVFAETKVDTARAAAISNEFQSKGVKVILVGPRAAAPTGEDVAARSAKLRLTLASKVG